MPIDRVCVMKAGLDAVKFRSSSQGFIYLGKWQLQNLAISQQSPTLGLCLSHIIGCRLISSGRRHDQEETSAAAHRHEAHEYSVLEYVHRLRWRL
ncbi:hypothetical protein BDV39DRAFT_197503 [Aspergillus sergii]|uniref:Uncharacterized protein n=1 Tax=Aspergillus sergii TaxID=1034303 RepID=A0A5N6WP05_9EURO|nr:hypothetical protein BDV39DRAFT_197503 [Aspergillus sergii]